MTTVPSEPLVRDRNTSVHVARPMFQVLPDDSQVCSCHVMQGDRVCTGFAAMRISAAEYARPDRWLL